MKAITVEPKKPETARYEDFPEPDLRDGSILVQALAVGVCGTDVEIVEGKYGWAPEGATRLVLGHESLGRVLGRSGDGGVAGAMACSFLAKRISVAITPAVQLWGGLISTYTDNELEANNLELRPFAGAKFFLPNQIKWNIYNFTRYEYRALQEQDTYDWNNYSRIRTRFGVEFPLVSRAKAWQPRTWYALTDTEPYYRFDKNRIDPLRVRGGIAYIVSDRVRVEFIYHAQFTRPAGSSGLEYTDNIFRLNVKLALGQGVLQRVFNGGDAD